MAREIWWEDFLMVIFFTLTINSVSIIFYLSSYNCWVSCIHLPLPDRLMFCLQTASSCPCKHGALLHSMGNTHPKNFHMLTFCQIKSITFPKCNLEAISSNFTPIIISGHIVYISSLLRNEWHGLCSFKMFKINYIYTYIHTELVIDIDCQTNFRIFVWANLIW